MIGPLENILNEVVKCDKEVEETQEHFLQAMADKVDAARAYVDAFEDFVKSAVEERPFDSEVQHAVEVLEELRRRYPKID